LLQKRNNNQKLLVLGTEKIEKFQRRQRFAFSTIDVVLTSFKKVLLFEFLRKMLENDVFSLVMHQTIHVISESASENDQYPSFQRDVNHFIRLIAWFVRFDYVKQVQDIRLVEDPKDVRKEEEEKKGG
jgi:hypothetical protein